MLRFMEDGLFAWLPILWVLVYLAVWASTGMSVLNSKLDVAARLVWLVIVAAAPVLGMLLWWAVGKPAANRRDPA
jgi:hypothetical protein